MYIKGKLKQLRLIEKKTIADVAIDLHERCGFVASTLWAWEQGKTCPTADNIDVLAKYYKVPITVFFK